jgi:hypothetical protein
MEENHKDISQELLQEKTILEDKISDLVINFCDKHHITNLHGEIIVERDIVPNFIQVGTFLNIKEVVENFPKRQTYIGQFRSVNDYPPTFHRYKLAEIVKYPFRHSYNPLKYFRKKKYEQGEE